MDKILLGNIVRDRRSGYEGIVTARNEYSGPYAAVYYYVEPEPIDGVMTELAVWMEQSQLEVIGKGTGLVGPRVCKSCGSTLD